MIVFVTTKLASNRDLGIEIILEILSLITNTNPNKIQEIISHPYRPYSPKSEKVMKIIKDLLK